MINAIVLFGRHCAPILETCVRHFLSAVIGFLDVVFCCGRCQLLLISNLQPPRYLPLRLSADIKCESMNSWYRPLFPTTASRRVFEPPTNKSSSSALNVAPSVGAIFIFTASLFTFFFDEQCNKKRQESIGESETVISDIIAVAFNLSRYSPLVMAATQRIFVKSKLVLLFDHFLFQNYY